MSVAIDTKTKAKEISKYCGILAWVRELARNVFKLALIPTTLVIDFTKAGHFVL